MGKLVRMIDEEGTLSVIAADSTDIVREMRSIHGTSKVCSAALGRMLTAATMMGSTLKGKDDSITVKINGGGPCGTVLAVSDSDGNVRGCIGKADISLPINKKGKLDVAGAVGKNGFVTVIKDLGLKEPYIGKTPIVSGEIAEDITSYYAVSEQIPTVCALGVLTEHDNGEIICAGGFMIQLLPTADDTIIERVEESIKDLPPVTKMLSNGMTPEEICKRHSQNSTCSCLTKRIRLIAAHARVKESKRLSSQQERAVSRRWLRTKPQRLSATSATKNIISQKKRFKKCSKEFKIKFTSA